MSTATSSTTAAGHPSQRVRQLWRAFEQWEAPRRTQMQQQCNKLPSSSRTKRQEIEDKHYLTAREEWQRRLAGAGLKDEDWGKMSAGETKAVELALGAGGAAKSTIKNGSGAEEVDNSMSLVPHASASNSAAAASNPSGLLQAPPQIGSSFSTSSISSYELVSPSELVSDDDRDDDDDDGAQGFMFHVAVETAQHDLRSVSASEDEGLELGVPFSYGQTTTSTSSGQYGNGYGVTSPTSSTSQWKPFEQPSYHHWSSSESSSRHPSANASPAQPPSKSFYSTSAMTGMSSITHTTSTSSSSSASAKPKSISSSPWAASASALSSTASPAHAAVPTSLFGTSPPEAGTAQASKPKTSSSSKVVSSSASASASASALVPVSAFSPSTNRGASQAKSSSTSSTTATLSSASTTMSTSMAIIPRQTSPPYIGPILSDSGEDADHDEGASDAGSQYDPEDAELEFKKFKTHTRIEKIIEFHREAAELEVRLVVEIERMRAEADFLPRDAEKKLIEGHQTQMRALQQSKELERKRIVKDERRRRRHALTAASASSSTSSLSLALVPQWNPNQQQSQSARTEKGRSVEWLTAYEKVPTDFEVPMPGGFGFEEEPSTASYHHPPSSSSSSPYPYGYPNQPQNQFGNGYPDLPTPQGPPYAGASFQHQQQQNGQRWSPPKTFSPPSSSSTSSSNNASPSSFWDSNPPTANRASHMSHAHSSGNNPNPNGRSSAGFGNNSLLRRPPTANARRPPSQSPEMFIARPRPMPAWNPATLEQSAEENEGGDDHRESQQEYDWGYEPGYTHGQGQRQGGGYEGYNSYDSGTEDSSQWSGGAPHHQTQQQYEPQQQQGYQQSPASMYETFQMSSSSFHDDDGHGNHHQAGNGGYFFGGESDMPDELRAAMGGFEYGVGQGQYSPNRREEDELKAIEDRVRREQEQFQAHQQQQRKGLPINARKNSDFGHEEKKGMPGSLKSRGGDQLNSSTNTLNGGVLNKTPTTTSPLASMTSKLSLGFGSLWGGRGTPQDDVNQVKEEEDSDSEDDEEGDENVEEESGSGRWFSSQPQKKQAPTPPMKKTAPPPPPAPAPTTAKGKRAAAAAAKAQAAAQAEAEAEAAAAAKAAEAEATKKAGTAKESKAAPPVPENTAAGGKKQTKKQKQAAAKKAGNGSSAKSEPSPAPTASPVEEKKASASPANAKDGKQAVEKGVPESTKKAQSPSSTLSSSALSTGSESSWGETSSTPRPSAATIKVQSGWGNKNQQQQQDVLGASKQPGMLRKQAVVQQAQQRQEMKGASAKTNGSGVPAIDTSPLPADLRDSLWSRASSRPAATPASLATPTSNGATSAVSFGWKAGGNKVKRNSDGTINVPGTSPTQNGLAKASNGTGSSSKARNGLAVALKKVTIEEVSDEEADASVDGSLGVESRYLLESMEELKRQQEIQQPRPSVPPSSYNNVFQYDHHDDSYAPPTPSTAPTSPPDDIPMGEELFSLATKQLKQQGYNAKGAGHSSSASGFASDWDATVKAKRPRWSTTGNGAARPASSATVGPGAGGSTQPAFRYKSSLAPPAMATPTTSSESDDLVSPLGGIPSGFPTQSRGNANGNSGSRGGGTAASLWREQMRAAAAANGGMMSSMSNAPSSSSSTGGWGQNGNDSGGDNALLDRFAQAQLQEEMKRGGKLF